MMTMVMMMMMMMMIELRREVRRRLGLGSTSVCRSRRGEARARTTRRDVTEQAIEGADL